MEASVPPSRSSASRGAVGEGTREFLSLYKSESGDFMTLSFNVVDVPLSINHI